MDRIATEEYFIAFLDVLNCKKIIQTDSHDVHLNQIRNIYTSWRQIINEKDFVFSQIELKIFSDNILLAIKTSCNRAADHILECVADIAEHFLVCGYKLRGGICKGKLYIDDTFVWGEGLVDAYNMESTEAKYPRIILSDDVVNSASKHIADIMFSIDAAYDNRIYLNYLRAFGRSKEYWIAKISEAQNKLTAELVALSTLPDERIMEKLRWLETFFEENLRYWQAKGEKQKW